MKHPFSPKARGGDIEFTKHKAYRKKHKEHLSAFAIGLVEIRIRKGGHKDERVILDLHFTKEDIFPGISHTSNTLFGLLI